MTVGELAREKLARLQEAWVLETDASRKFKLEKEIEETEAQVRAFGETSEPFSMTKQKLRNTDKSINLKDSQAAIPATGDNTVDYINQNQKPKLLYWLLGGGGIIVIGLVIFFMSGGNTNNVNVQVSHGAGSPNISNSGSINFNYTATPSTTKP